MADNLLVIRDRSKKDEIEKALPYGWKALCVGDIFENGKKYNVVIVGCELHKSTDWQWYQWLIKNHLEHKDKLPIWAS